MENSYAGVKGQREAAGQVGVVHKLFLVDILIELY